MDYPNNWQEEKRSAYLYRMIATYEPSVLQKKMFADLGVAAEKQAVIWEERMQEAHIPIPTFKPDLRLKIVSTLVNTFGVHRMRSILSAMKIRGMSALSSTSHHEHQHIATSSANNLRAAVFGVNDGLISNMSLILGMVGANADIHTILVAGTAGLLAGAASMGAGEYISVRSQREVFEYQIEIERQELAEYPEEEKEELSLIYQTRGVPKADADSLAAIMINNPETGLATLAREELGLNPDDIVSPLGAMVYSFIAFSIGAFLPLIPFIMSQQASSIWTSIAVTCTTLFCIGMVLSLFSNKPPLWSGIRMLFVGLLAGIATYGIGLLLGVTLS